MLEEYQRLAALIASFREIEEHRLHKLVYVLQTIKAPFSYEFRMGSRGPYSEALEDDLRLLAELGLVDRVPTVTSSRVVAKGRAEENLRKAEELRPFLDAAREVIAVPVEVLDFAATLGAWLGVGYRFSDALDRTRKTTRPDSPQYERDAVGFLRKHGLVTT
jgi:uncharacterized protein YwgA